MRFAPLIARMYPSSVRQRWGSELLDEIEAAGWRGLPNALVGVADLWLHPAVWPAVSPRQRRLRMTTMAVFVALACWLVSLATVELGGSSEHAAGHSLWMSTGTLLILVGLGFVVPRPDVRALADMCRLVVASLAIPAALGVGVVVAVHVGVGGSTLTRTAVLACWWASLVSGVFQACRALAASGSHVVPARAGRLWVGTAVLAAGAAVYTVLLLGVSLDPGSDLSAAATSLGLLGLLSTFVLVLRDTRRFSVYE